MGRELPDYRARPFLKKGADVCCLSAISKRNCPVRAVLQGSHVTRDPGQSPGSQVWIHLGFGPLWPELPVWPAKPAKPRSSGLSARTGPLVCLLSQTRARDGPEGPVPTRGASLVVRLLGRRPQPPTVRLQGRPQGGRPSDRGWEPPFRPAMRAGTARSVRTGL